MLDFKIPETSLTEKLKSADEPIVLYGTGNGADKIFRLFEKENITVSGVAASDGFVRNRSFHGFAVKPISYFESVYSSFTVVVGFGSSRPEVMGNIRAVASHHNLLVACVPVIGEDNIDRAFLYENEEKLNTAYRLLDDNRSKDVFAGYIGFQFSGELPILDSITTDEDEAWSSLSLGAGETFVDIGAYRGDTVEKFLSFCGGDHSHIFAVEPDKKSFEKLTAFCEMKKLDRVSLINAAAYSHDGLIAFSNDAGRQSKIGGEEYVKCLSLETIVSRKIPTFVKIDSEGCERDILSGAAAILKNHKPRLCIAAYHKSRDIFELPILINECNPEYRIRLRHHPYIPAWDTLFYCL